MARYVFSVVANLEDPLRAFASLRPTSPEGEEKAAR